MENLIGFNLQSVYQACFKKLISTNLAKIKTPLCVWIASLYLITSYYFVTEDVLYLKPDPRVENWLLLSDNKLTVLITVLYIVFSIFGPKLMENRKPFQLDDLLKLYNFTQIFVSAYICQEFLGSAVLCQYSLGCQAAQVDNSPASLKMAAACWWYFFSKIIDTLDTVFIILRKKNSQVSFLHVFHHGSMIINWWYICKYTPGGQVFFSAMLNAFVHVVMYTYYFLATFGPRVQKYLWWKKYLTLLQITQFAAVLVHTVNGLLTTCEFPISLSYCMIMYGFSLLQLFTLFYFETYLKQYRANKEIS